VLLVALLAVTWSCAQAAPSGGVGTDAPLSVSIGFSGRARMGAWTPVWIDLTAPPAGVDGTLTLQSTASSGTTAVRYAAPVRAGPGARVRVFVPAVFYDSRAPGMLHLDEAGGRVASFALPRLRPVDDLVLVLSSEAVGVEAATGGESSTGGGERLEVVYLTPEDLPPIWQAYESVRLVVVRTLDERRVDDAQRLALRRWVWSGGRILAMPAGDDVRHLRGAALRDLLPGVVTSVTSDPQIPVAVIQPRPGSETLSGEGVRAVRWRTGRGGVVLWDRDGAHPAWRGSGGARRAWQAVLAERPSTLAPDLESTLAAHRSVPLRTHLLTGGFILLYLAAARTIGILLSRWRLATALVAAAAVIAATLAASQAGLTARRDASGVLVASVVEAWPGTGHGLLSILARTVLSHDGGFAVGASDDVLLRPVPPASVTVLRRDGVVVTGTERTVRLSGSGVVPIGFAGTFARRDEGAVVSVLNRTGRRLEQPWIYSSGRVQSIPSIASDTQIVLEDQRWQTRDRLQRTEPNHALLLWAFSHLESDAILKTTPTWLVGWARDPALGLRWGDRQESAPQLVLVPLTAP